MNDIRIEALKNNYNTYRDNLWKFATLGIAVLGWLMTSTEARNYLSNSIIVSIGLSSTLILGIISHWLVNYSLIEKNNSMISELREEKTMSLAYEMYSLDRVRFILNGVSLTILITACLVVIWVQ